MYLYTRVRFKHNYVLYVRVKYVSFIFSRTQKVNDPCGQHIKILDISTVLSLTYIHGYRPHYRNTTECVIFLYVSNLWKWITNAESHWTPQHYRMGRNKTELCDNLYSCPFSFLQNATSAVRVLVRMVDRVWMTTVPTRACVLSAMEGKSVL